MVGFESECRRNVLIIRTGARWYFLSPVMGKLLWESIPITDYLLLSSKVIYDLLIYDYFHKK